MSHGRAIDPIDISQFPTEQDVADPGFEQLFGELVGIAGTDADGFDDDVAIANSLLDSLDGALSLLSGQDGGTLDDAFADIFAVDPEAAGADVVNLSSALPDVQSNVDNLGNLLTGATLPTPPQPPGPLPADCAALAGFDTTTSAPPFTRQFSFVAGGPSAILTIDSQTLTQDTAGLFTLAPCPTGQVPSGQVCTFSVTLNVSAPSGVHGKVVTTYHLQDGISRSDTLCLGVNTGDNFPQPSGGGGTPPPNPTPPGTGPGRPPLPSPA